MEKYNINANIFAPHTDIIKIIMYKMSIFCINTHIFADYIY